MFAAVPLGVDPVNSDRTNHPVLFVHGHSLAADKGWDVEMVGNCVDSPSVQNVTIISNVTCKTVNAKTNTMKWYYYYLNVTLQYDVKLTDLVTKQNQVKVINRLIRYKSTEFLGTDTVFYGGIIDSVEITYDSINDALDYSYIYLSTNTKVTKKTRVGIRDKWYHTEFFNPEWQEITTLDQTPSGLDFVRKYNNNSSPDFISKTLELSTEYDSLDTIAGINSNGLYFYNSKKAVVKTDIVGNDGAKLELIDISNYGNVSKYLEWDWHFFYVNVKLHVKKVSSMNFGFKVTKDSVVYDTIVEYDTLVLLDSLDVPVDTTISADTTINSTVLTAVTDTVYTVYKTIYSTDDVVASKKLSFWAIGTGFNTIQLIHSLVNEHNVNIEVINPTDIYPNNGYVYYKINGIDKSLKWTDYTSTIIPSGINVNTVIGWKQDTKVAATWNTDIQNLGQSNQLHDRIIDVLNKYYVSVNK